MLKFNISNRNILALIVIVTPFIPIFGPIWLIDYSAKCRNNIIKRELRFAGIAYCILQLGLILSLIIPSIVRDKHKVGISHLESNMISIKIALEKYYFATQAYPENIDSLINKGFISGYIIRLVR
jgi:competence protein ComGC